MTATQSISGMRYLPILRKGRTICYAVVDSDTWEWASEYRWYLQLRGTGGMVSVTRYISDHGVTKNVFLAREIMGVRSSLQEVYPVDGDPFNLRRENLAVGTRSQRQQHQETLRRMGRYTKPRLGIVPVMKAAVQIWEALNRGSRTEA